MRETGRRQSSTPVARPGRSPDDLRTVGPVDADAAPLAGFTVAVTADRRHDELAGLLERRGARVVVAPASCASCRCPDDADLRAATRDLRRQARWTSWWRPPPSGCAAGWRRPRAGASPTRCGRRLRRRAPRGPRPADARAAARGRRPGIRLGPAGRQLRRRPGPPAGARRRRPARSPSSCTASRSRTSARPCARAGADVLEIPVYRWGPPTDPAPLRRLVDLIGGRLVDAVTFTSRARRALAARRRRSRRCWTGCATDVTAACVGQLTAAPLVAARRPGGGAAAGRGWASWSRALADELPNARRRCRSPAPP